MKKILAILLVLAMLIPLGVTAQAEEIPVKPFYYVNMATLKNEYSNADDIAFFWAPNNQWDEDGEPLGEPRVQYNGAEDIAQIAAILKEDFDDRPDGTRYINFLSLIRQAFYAMNEEVIFMEKAVKYVQDWLYPFLEEYKSIGGKLDGIILDQEYTARLSYYLSKQSYVNDPLIYHKIVTNPMYGEKLRPMLVERGFQFYPNPTEYTPEIFSIYLNSGDEYEQSRAIWDAAVTTLFNSYTTEAVYTPLKEYYPDAIVSDYQARNINAWDNTPSDSGGNQASGGNIATAGNSSNYNTYSHRPALAFFQNANGPLYNSRKVTTFVNAIYENTPYNGFMWDANVMKDMYSAADGININTWIGHYLYPMENPNSPSETPYFTETVLHIGLLDCDPFIGYTTLGTVSNDQDLLEHCMEVNNDIMVELTRVVGYADREPIFIPATWNSSFVLSGMYANGRNVFRITPDTTKVSLENFKVEGATDPTFYVNGQTVTFPGGKIIADGNIREVGTCGYWVETDKDVMPVVTSEANRFETYPAYIQNFESYQVGTEMTFDVWQPEACWEVKKNKQTVCVIKADPSDPNNQILEISGPSYVLKNVQLPININSADSYAKHQAWEVTLTLPANLSADAQIVLLDAYGERVKTKDTGVIIKGGKVYYDKAGESVELPGVDLSAGGKITVKREMDFTDYKAVICDYSIYGADGTLLGQVKGVPVAQIDVPVLGIGMGFKNLNAAVLVDDYKLYVTDVVADFTLYDAKLGTVVTEADKARAADTVYRLSWLNATQSEKTYAVMAAYYNGDTLVSESVVEEVKMAPNSDGVAIGKVENKVEGQTLRVYLKDNSPAEDSNNGSGKAPNKAFDGNMTLLIVAAATFLVLSASALVITLVFVQAKKNQKAASTMETASVEEVPAEETSAEETSPAETFEADEE